MKKRVLFVINNMKMGGTRKGLLYLMKCLPDYSDVSIDLLILSRTGPLISEIPDNVYVIPKNKILNAVFTDIEDLTSLSDISIHLIVWSLRKLLGYKNVYSFICKKLIRRLKLNSYDASIGFQEGYCNDVAYMIPAKKHFAWIHSNYDTVKDSVFEAGIPELYPHFDNIIFVAEANRNLFLRYYPSLNNKCIVIKNIIDTDAIQLKAKEEPEYIFPDCKYKIVTVGRIAEVKRYDRIIECAAVLKNKQISFHWVIIGDGKGIEKLRLRVAELDLEENVAFIGQKGNPYSVVSRADLFVLTSESESQPLVLIEALLVGTPVLSTKFDSAVELFNQKSGGELCSNSTEGVIQGVLHILEDETTITRMKQKAADYVYDNSEIAYELISRF